LEVLFEALSTVGVPKGMVSDGGGQFYSNQAMCAYRMLDICKERICNPKQSHLYDID
jgi:hypothetical protein